eukprot:2542448-Pyramimonas_sp.AAC.1
MYSAQTATARTNATNRTYKLQRGTKLGDRLRSLLVNSLLGHHAPTCHRVGKAQPKRPTRLQ